MVAERTPPARPNQLSEDSRLCTVADAARLLGVSPSTVWRWVDAGKLPALRIGPKAIRIRQTDLKNVVRATDKQQSRSWMSTVYTNIEDATRPLTDAERASILETLAYAERASGRTKLLTDSAEIIREARDERSRRI